MALDFDAIWLDRQTEHEIMLGTLYNDGYVPTAFFENVAFWLDRKVEHEILFSPAYTLELPVLPIPEFFDGFFIDINVEHEILFSSALIVNEPIAPIFENTAWFIIHWTLPPVYEQGDTAFFIVRSLPVVIVDFSVNTRITFVCVRINFETQTDGTEYLWFFGDGATSTKRNPKHEYKKAGVYTVILIIDGTRIEKADFITVWEKSFILDAGAVYLNYGEKGQLLLGATEGGNLFGIDQTFRHMSFDGEQGQLIGSHRLVESKPKIIANMVEINYRLLNIALSCSNVSFSSGTATITRALRKLVENDYIKNVAIVAEHGGHGSLVVFKILNAITVENVEIPFEDSSESVIEITFAGSFESSDLDTEPWQIEFILIK